MMRAGLILMTALATTGVGYPGLSPMPTKLIWNASGSVPIGLYKIDGSAPLGVSDLAAINPHEELTTYLAERGYLPKGMPLLKRVRAVAGQMVCRTGHTVSVDGIEAGDALVRDRAGRDLPVWQGCRRIQTDEIFLMNWQVLDSFDGRYFGPTPTDTIIGRAVPLWTDEDGVGRFRWHVRPANAP